MPRKARATLHLPCLFALFALVFVVSSVRAAPVGDPMPVAGAPFSAVATQQVARNFVDGNRVDRGGIARFYRDSQGRTRVERGLPAAPGSASARLERGFVRINDPVAGATCILHPDVKIAEVLKRSAGTQVLHAPVAPLQFVVNFGGRSFGPTERGWSSEVSLGEKTIDGIRAVGSRRDFTIATGTLANAKPIVITVEQWFSPELGELLAKSARASTGGEFSYVLESIVRAEPDASLFTIPPDYTRRESGQLTSIQAPR